MKANRIIAVAVVLSTTGSAFAASDYASPAEGFTSTKSRAEVVTELTEAKAQGLMAYRDGDYPVAVSKTGAPLSRAQVRADEIQWTKTHPHRQAGVNDLYFG